MIFCSWWIGRHLCVSHHTSRQRHGDPRNRGAVARVDASEGDGAVCVFTLQWTWLQARNSAPRLGRREGGCLLGRLDRSNRAFSSCRATTTSRSVISRATGAVKSNNTSLQRLSREAEQTPVECSRQGFLLTTERNAHRGVDRSRDQCPALDSLS